MSSSAGSSRPHLAHPSAYLAQLDHPDHVELHLGTTMQARLVVLQRSVPWPATCPIQA
ncbi:hypothetical protein A2U01_0103101 [Trifolium medium]|uniref:Uncharacterized protein n=1 Tax=Trifolium medium TaxID=97028 RepID=A0A392V128_9FABA|nr:hypothetical protein [Trifolium medium]